MTRAFTMGSLSRAYGAVVIDLGIANASLGSGWTQTQIDFRSDDINTDYSLRFARGNTGANAPSYFQNKGTSAVQLVAVEAGTVQFFTSNTLTALVSAAGRFATYKQPFFSASYDATTVATLNTNVIWSVVTYNVGSHYNATTGQFTAPVAGDYLFYFRMLFIDTAAGRVDLLLFKNNAAIAPGCRFAIQKPASTYHSLHGTIILALAANDIISVRPNPIGPGFYSDSNYNAFGGYFLG